MDNAFEKARAAYGSGAYNDATLEFLFPELKDSEDERIRKELVKLFEEKLQKCYEWKEGIPNRSVLDWLEKQKERGPLSKDEEYTLARIIEYLEDNDCPSEWKDLLHDVYSLPYQKEQKPAEWSEEDENKLEQCIRIVSGWEGDYDIVKSPYSNFLKSLRPQPKQDVFPSLSEKEIICLKRALDYLRKEHNRYGGEDFTNEIAVLEWLITHPILVFDTHWKPSEEQMDALRVTLEYMPDTFKPRCTLMTLQNDLKKLM